MPAILIVGGGFAGFWAAVAAKRVVGARAEVSLVSRGSALQMRPILYQANPRSLAVQLQPLLDSVAVKLIVGEAIALHEDSGQLELADGSRHSYDRLVVATGSFMRRPSIPGAEDAYSIDTQSEAVLFDEQLSRIATRIAKPTILIVGAGFTGIELALEMRDRLLVHADETASESARIVLLDRSETIGDGLGHEARQAVLEALREARIDLRLGVDISALSRHTAILSGGDTVFADIVVLTTGMSAAVFTQQVSSSRDELDRLIVDRNLRVCGSATTFAAGDSAAAILSNGRRVLQSCQHSLITGRVAGENAGRHLLGQQLLTYDQPRYVTCVDLGRSGAVLTEGWDRTFVASGQDAKKVKQRINSKVIYPPYDVAGDDLLALSNAPACRSG